MGTSAWKMSVGILGLVALVGSCGFGPFAPVAGSVLELSMDLSGAGRNFSEGDLLELRVQGPRSLTLEGVSVNAGTTDHQVTLADMPYGTYQIAAVVRSEGGQVVYRGSNTVSLAEQTKATSLVLSAPRAITSFAILGRTATISINDPADSTIRIYLPWGTDPSNLSPVVQWEGRSISPVPGPANFLSPQSYTVFGADEQDRIFIATAIASASIGTTGSSSTVALGDINGDSRVDAVLQVATDNHVVYLAQDDRSFTLSQDLNTSGQTVYGSWLGDINNDGYAEYFTAGPNGASTSHNALYTNSAGVLSSGGTNTYALTSSVVAFYGFAVVSAPLNGDAYHDVVWWESGNLHRALADGAGSLTASSFVSYTMATGGSEYAGLQAQDLDGDADIDVVVAKRFNGIGQGSLSLFLNDGTGNFSLVPVVQADYNPPFTTYFNPVAVTAGDWNGDGRQDLVVTNQGENSSDPSQGLWVGLRTSNNGASPMYAWTKLTNAFISVSGVSSSSGGVNRLSTGDWNMDGYDDLLVGNGISGSPGLYFLNGAVTNALSNGVLVTNNLSNSAWAMDMDGDGKLDAISREGTTVKVYYQ